MSRAKQGLANKTAFEQGLRPWSEVAKEWKRLSGQTLSRSRVWQICKRAEEKIAEAIKKD